MKYEFNIGEKVKIKKTGDFIHDLVEACSVGEIGTVINIKVVKAPNGKEHINYGVEFDSKHNPALKNIKPSDAGCNSIDKKAKCKILKGKAGKLGYCKNFSACELELFKDDENEGLNESISIKGTDIHYTKDGVTYLASCEKDDEFDLEKGVMIALLKANGVKYSKVRQLTEELEGKVKKDIDRTFDKLIEEIDEALSGVKFKKGDYVKIKDGKNINCLGKKCVPNKVYKVLDVSGFLCGGTVILEGGTMILGKYLEKVNKK